jgi:hypothetical protein
MDIWVPFGEIAPYIGPNHVIPSSQPVIEAVVELNNRITFGARGATYAWSTFPNKRSTNWPSNVPIEKLDTPPINMNTRGNRVQIIVTQR